MKSERSSGRGFLPHDSHMESGRRLQMQNNRQNCPQGNNKALEAAEVETPSATTQIRRQVVIYIEHTYEYRMFILIKMSILDFVSKAADTFSRPTSFLIIKRQQLGRNAVIVDFRQEWTWVT